MGYEDAFEAAGAVVHDSEYFGSYQGDAIFKVTFEGTTGFVVVSYGSCSGCDAFESAFGYSGDETPEQLAAFGRSYLDEGQVLDAEAMRARFEGQLTWDFEARYILDWVAKHV